MFGSLIMRLNECALIYQENLKNSKEALNYLKSRGITSNTIQKFMLGYCSNNIASYTLSAKYTNEQLQDTGIFHIKDQKIYDLFNRRITIPVMSDTEVKYMTSRYIGQHSIPHLHQKGKIELAVNHNILKHTNLVVIVEGPFDCFALDQIGIPSIGLLGAHRLTRQIISELYNKDVYICFDNDHNESGQKASYRVAKKLSNFDIQSKIIFLPRGNEQKVDVDVYLKSHDKKDFMNLMQKSRLYNKANKKIKYKSNVNGLDIIKIISHYIPIIPSGGRFKAICPFHQDSQASLMIYENTNSAYCFGCGTYFGPIRFVKEIEQKRGNTINEFTAESIARKI